MSPRPISLLIADRAVQGVDGKIEIQGGGIAALRFESLPARSRPLGILVAVEGPRGAQADLDLLIRLFDPVGRDLLGLEGHASLSRHVPAAGELPLSWIAITLPEIPLSVPGLHRLVVAIGAHEVAAPLLVEGPQGALPPSDARSN